MTPRIGISAWAIKNPVPVVVIMLALIVAGLIAYPRLPIKKYPNIEFPAVSVTIKENGATAAELETQVTRPIENALAGLTNVEAVVSTIAQGTSTTVVQFQLGENLEVASDQVRARVELVRAQLPAEIDPPVVARVDIDDAPILSYAVESDTLSVNEVSWLIDDALTRTLQRQSGVGQVSRVGGVERAINVTVDPARLAAVGLTLPQLNDTLRKTIVNDPGGRTAIGGREQALRVLNMQTSGAALRSMLVPIAGGRFVTLSDVAEIGDGEAETRSFARLDGAPAVGFQVSKTRDASELSVEDEVDATLKSFVAAHPAIHIRKIYSTVDETRGSYHATLRALLEGMLLSALAVWIFLRDPRATLIAAIAMPASLIPTFGCHR
jgi:HAE1 family hydrophobic/amphiphilic exporter-1